MCVDCRFPQVQFEYNDPSANFDRRRVRGPVVRLMTVREREAATALEVTAGGRVRREEGEEVCVLKSEGTSVLAEKWLSNLVWVLMVYIC